MTGISNLPNFYAGQLSTVEIEAGAHRELIGGFWEEIGALQFGFLVGRGLRPEMILLDVGCGCLRGGVHFIRYLDEGHYFGMDANASLLRAGYDYELERMNLQERAPRGNFLENENFEAWRFGVEFDFALAQSVFTHLPREWLRLCLGHLARCVRRGGEFYFTYFECPDDWPSSLSRTCDAHGGATFPDRDPFHYRVHELRECASGLPWLFENIGPWGHPRGQHIALYIRE